MTSNKNAGFILRVLAGFAEGQIFLLPSILLLSYALGSTSIPELGARFTLLIVWIAILTPVMFFYGAATTYWWGGTIGKLLTGLRVTDEGGKPMNFKRLFFRHTIGYQFSGLLFGLGFLSIIKDQNKQSWHDKTVGSQVLVVKNLWPVALVVFTVLIILNSFIGVSSMSKFFNSDLYINQISPTFDYKSEPRPSPNPRNLPEDVIF